MDEKEKYLRSSKRKAIFNILIAFIYNLALILPISFLYKDFDEEIFMLILIFSFFVIFILGILSLFKYFFEVMGNYYLILSSLKIKKINFLKMSSLLLIFPGLNLVSIILSFIFLLK